MFDVNLMKLGSGNGLNIDEIVLIVLIDLKISNIMIKLFIFSWYFLIDNVSVMSYEFY